MGCSQSDTSQQTAYKRERRVAAKQQNSDNSDESTLFSDETVSTNHHHDDSSNNNTSKNNNNSSNALASKAMQKIQHEMEKKMTTQSKSLSVLGGGAATRSPSASSPHGSPREHDDDDDDEEKHQEESTYSATVPGAARNPLALPAVSKISAPGTKPTLRVKIADHPTTDLEAETTTGITTNNSSSSNKQHKTNVVIAVLGGHPTKHAGHGEGDSSDSMSEMGEVEMSSQVGHGSSIEGRRDDSGDSPKHHSGADKGPGSLVVLHQSPDSFDQAAAAVDVVIPKTFLPDGKRHRRIDAWIDGTKAFQICQVHQQAKQQSKMKNKNMLLSTKKCSAQKSENKVEDTLLVPVALEPRSTNNINNAFRDNSSTVLPHQFSKLLDQNNGHNNNNDESDDDDSGDGLMFVDDVNDADFQDDSDDGRNGGQEADHDTSTFSPPSSSALRSPPQAKPVAAPTTTAVAASGSPKTPWTRAALEERLAKLARQACRHGGDDDDISEDESDDDF